MEMWNAERQLNIFSRHELSTSAKQVLNAQETQDKNF